MNPEQPHIGRLNEKSLHADLKQWLAQPDDQFEVAVDGFVIDIVRGERLIEIQTRNFGAMKRKLSQLLTHHPVHLVHPIAQEKWIVKLSPDGKQIGRRKSPKQGTTADLFRELVAIPHLMTHDNFSLELLLIQEEETRYFDGSRGWRRKGWLTQERHLLTVTSSHTFHTPADLLALLPPDLPSAFTTAHIAQAMAIPRALAQKMAYCLQKMSVIEAVGKDGRSILYHKS
ncbi:MAG: hypothetical protein H6658_07680 [Ardenticatenaceae bacterium]|nr:hypothetical protein [Ardenticatenaceae bacterium]